MIPTLIVVSLFVFFLIQLPPGDFLTTYVIQMEERGADAEMLSETLERLRSRYGMDDPFPIQYVKWIGGIVFRGDWGESFQYFGTPVGELLYSRLGNTLLITFGTLIFAWVVAIPIGIYSATHQYSFLDNVFTFVSFIGRSIPNFFLALLLMTFVAVVFGGSVGGLQSEQFYGQPWSFAKLLDLLAHLWIPIVVIGTARTAEIMRVMRGNLLDILNVQYVQTARAKGLAERVVVYKHAVRNALHPLVMMLGMQIPKLISGAMIVSVVLSLPTIGPLLLEALNSQDMYLAGSILLIQALLLVLGNLVADLLLAWIDPRVQYE
mgnify:CR=1 FL=1